MSTAIIDNDMHIPTIHSPTVPFPLPESSLSCNLPITKELSPGDITPPTPTGSKDHTLSPTSTAGKKRTATGQIKQSQNLAQEALRWTHGTNHARTYSDISTASNGTVTELSSQLRTRLTYAMLKVQNGWQNRSLDEVESLASQSPRSTKGHSRHDTTKSPQLNRQNSGSSTGSESRFDTIPPSNDQSRGLAPPANIIAGQRRRPTPNIDLQPPNKRSNVQLRPLGATRTPSQNAAMEADAVETLLFMASPNNSGHHPSTFSPSHSNLSNQHLPSQTSPLRSQFSNTDSSPKKVAFSISLDETINREAMLESLVDKLDEEDNEELDEAVRLMDSYHTAKLTT